MFKLFFKNDLKYFNNKNSKYFDISKKFTKICRRYIHIFERYIHILTQLLRIILNYLYISLNLPIDHIPNLLGLVMSKLTYVVHLDDYKQNTNRPTLMQIVKPSKYFAQFIDVNFLPKIILLYW